MACIRKRTVRNFFTNKRIAKAPLKMTAIVKTVVEENLNNRYRTDPVPTDTGWELRHTKAVGPLGPNTNPA